MAGLRLILVAVLCFTTVIAQPPPPLRIAPAIIGASSGPRSCPADDLLQMARMNSSGEARNAIQNTPCGGIGWAQIVNLDMSDNTQQCPTPWTLFTAPVRSCSIPGAGCQQVTYPVPMGTYTRVCGRALAVETGTPDGFHSGLPLDQAYMDGVGLTHGNPRQHIFSFVGGHGAEFGAANVRCPCENPNRVTAPLPAFVGNNYFCDNDGNGALWDGMDCTTACCTFNDPPYFTLTLPAPTSDNIDIRICANSGRGDETINLQQLEIYVQ